MENPSGAVNGNSQNVPTANVPRTRSTFPLKYHMFDTMRFGYYHPHFCMECVKDDDIPLISSHRLMTNNLKSPLLQDLTLHKDYFSVPMEAILPLNWEKIFDNPVRGDDITNLAPSGQLPYTYDPQFWYNAVRFWKAALNTYQNIAANSSTTAEILLLSWFRLMLVGEMYFSDGNLLASLGCSGSQYMQFSNSSGKYISYDEVFEMEMSNLKGQVKEFVLTIDGYTYYVDVDGTLTHNDYPGRISFNHCLALLRDNPTFDLVNITYRSGCTLATLKSNLGVTFNSWIRPTESTTWIGLDIARLWAYQLSCAHYFSNDHVDFIYSADLYRSLVKYYVINASPNAATLFNNSFFTYNGVDYQYDALCATYYRETIALWAGNINYKTLDATCCFAYLSALFSYRRSLRYLDYFTGSRTSPLAVGSVSVAVNSNLVDVVDVTRNIQKQRFLNAVNRVRHSFEGYLKGIFGGETPAPDYHNPFYLAHTEDVVYGDETPNTGSAQIDPTTGIGLPISITTNLRSNASKSLFTFHCDRPSILIGITHFDLPRVYASATERGWFTKDRFDMFNPFMQYVGDQPIYLQELGIGNRNSVVNFAYTLRNMEYKQKYNQCAGAFVKFLPSWIFKADDWRGNQYTLNPDWIRSLPSELDDFYMSMEYHSLGGYYHFIVDNYNVSDASRPMSYAPSIL